MPDHVHMMISIPPKYAVSQVIGYIKGKSAIHIARRYAERKRNFVGQHFWARGYFVSTVGRDEEVIREYIRHQEQEDRRVDRAFIDPVISLTPESELIWDLKFTPSVFMEPENDVPESSILLKVIQSGLLEKSEQ